MSQYLLIAIAVLTLALGGAGWALKHQIGENAELDLKIGQAQEEVNKLTANVHAVAELDKQHQEDLQHAKTENDQLMARVDSGRVRLYIPTHCVQPASPSTGEPDANPRAELDQSARADYSELRSAITEQDLRVKGLQDYITKVCLKESST